MAWTRKENVFRNVFQMAGTASQCKAGMSELIIVTGTDSISPKGAEPTGRLISTDSCFTLHRRGNALFHDAIAYQSGLGFTIHGQVPGTGHQKIELCFTICFTVCLFISPDLDGHRAPKMKYPSDVFITICFIPPRDLTRFRPFCH